MAAALLLVLIPATVAAGTIVFLMAFAACGIVIGPHESEYVATGQFLISSITALVSVIFVFRGFLRVLTILLGPTKKPSPLNTNKPNSPPNP